MESAGPPCRIFGRRWLALWLIAVTIWLSGAVAAQDDGRSTAQANLPRLSGTTDLWNGFERVSFQFEGRSAYIVRPHQAAPGNPWVWRARFPNFHAEADRILLGRGLHVAYLNTNGLLGAPVAMDCWDKFYQHAVKLGLAKQVALEGVSRGGLFVYGFAARWPERVSCIYADTPVCDGRSWPGGLGAGKGSPADWRVFQKLYGLEGRSEQEIEAFKGNPIDRLEAIAKAKLPLLHIVSMNDTVVPPAENTLRLQQQLKQLGWDLDLIRVNAGTPESNGHHFRHPDPTRVADFIERHAVVIPTGSRAESFVLRGQLGQSARVFQDTGKGRVAFVGGSITNMKGWREATMRYLQQRFPETEFEFINAGVPSTGSVPGAFRLNHDVLDKGKIDLLFEEASVNDVTNGRSPQQMTRGMEGILRQAIRSNPRMDIVMMHFACPTHTKDYRQGNTPETIQRHEAVAKHYAVSSIDLAWEVTMRIDAGQFSWKDDFRDLHPSPYGHQIYVAAIRRLLSRGFDQNLKTKVSSSAAPSSDGSQGEVTMKLPPPIDTFSYDRGRFVALERIVAAKGFAVKQTDPRANGVGGGVRDGFVNVPMLVGQAGDVCEFKFQGRAVALFVAAGPDAGQIEYQVDQRPTRTLNLSTRWSRGLHLPWVYVLEDELDDDQQHTLRLKVLPKRPNRDQAGQGVCRIVHMLVNE